MKRTIVILTLLFAGFINAQEGPKISSAIIAFNRQDIPEAKQYIDEASQLIETKEVSAIKSKDLAKFYFYNGKINYQIATSQDATIKALDADALTKATESYKKLIAFESSTGKGSKSDAARTDLSGIAAIYGNQGITQNNNKEFAEAYMSFKRCYDLKKEMEMGTDTSMLYNAAVMAQNAGSIDEAIAINKELVALNYQGRQYFATSIENGEEREFASRKQMDRLVRLEKYKDPRVEGDIRASLYVTLANLSLKKDDQAGYDSYIKKGRAAFPEDETLLRAELQTYLEKEEFDKALVNLEAAIVKDPNSKMLHYIMGFIYQTDIKDAEKAVVAYDKAIALDEDYMDPIYMRGLIHVEKANAFTEDMNKLGFNETTKYNAFKKKQDAEFKLALPYFEKAHSLEPKDEDTLKALKEVYYKLKMYQEAKDTQAKLDGLG